MKKFIKKFDLVSKANKALSVIWLIAITFSIIGIVVAATPNPGHDFSAIGGGAAQGDILYGSAVDTLAALPKNTSATRYLSNTGTDNNPAWAQIDLTNGVTNILPSANGGTANAFFTVSGPASTAKTFTFPNANATVLTSNAPVTVAQGGTGLAVTADDAVFVGDSTSAITARVLPSCSNAINDKLLYNSGTNTFTCGTDQAVEGGGGPATEATYTFASTGIVASTDGTIMDVFNGAGSGQVMRVVEVAAYQRNSAAVVGISVPVEIVRTTAVGTGGTSIDSATFDSSDTSLAGQITARTGPTGGATATGGILGGSKIHTEEASIGTTLVSAFPWLFNYSNVYVNNGTTPRQRLTLREGEGLSCKWGHLGGQTAAGLGACIVTFQIGGAYSNELPTYSWQSNSLNGSNKKMIDIFNATGSGKILRITRVVIYARPIGAITGAIKPYEIFRTSSVGTGGTTITADKYDTANDNVPAQITARDAPSGGAAVTGGALIASVIGTDETSHSEYGGFGITSRGSNVQFMWDGSSTRRPLTVRPGEGITIIGGPFSAVGNTVIIVEGTLE